MPAFLHNRYIQFIGGFILILIGVPILFTLVTSLFSSSTGLQGDVVSNAPNIGSTMSNRAMMESDMMESDMMVAPANDLYYPTPSPSGGYSAELERYETTDYSVSGRTQDFSRLCSDIRNLKANDDVHFKSLTESLNACTAVFFVDESKADGLVTQFMNFDGISVNRSTQSVTRHREQLQSQTEIIRQQLASVNRSLAVAETEFDEIATFARENNDAATLSGAITEKLRLIDTLTARKISLTNQLDTLYQRSAELNERIGVAQFSVNVTRSYQIELGKTSRKWEQAWNELSETFTDTLIGITAFFGVFLLWTIRLTLYALVVLLVLRGVWKFGQYLWKR